MEIKKSIKEIICVGTSFTEGDGLNPKNINHHAVKWYLKNKGIKINSISEYCWPTVLQSSLNIPVKNLGKSGSSIEYLIRNVEEILETSDCKDTLFILEYSNWGRSELWSTKFDTWLVANWGPRDGNDPANEGYAVMITTDYNFGTQLEQSDFTIYECFLDNFFNQKEYLLQRDRNFLNLLYKLKAENISYQVVVLETPYLLYLKDHPLFNYKELLEDNLWGFVKHNNLSIEYETNKEVMDPHPSITGHKHLANVFHNKLQEKYNFG
jgi:hypothetical protein